MLTPYLPYPLLTGGQTRSYNLIKRLSSLGHRITLFSLIKDADEKKYVGQLERFCEEVRVFSRSKKPWTLKNILKTGFSYYPFLVVRNLAKGEKKEIEKKLSSEKFDLIHAETFYVMPHIPKTNLPILLVEQTIEFSVYKHFVDNFGLIFLKPLLYFDVLKMRFWELKYWRRAKKVVAMSDEDKAVMLRQDTSLKVEIIPNGVDIDYFGKATFKKEPYPIILYLGNFTWLQNREAVTVLVEKIWPKIKKEVKNAKLWIIGKDAKKTFPNIKGENIRIDQVEDVREAYQKATVLVAPIFGGGGTRYKNFEAFASGLPVVTTSIGIGGTDAKNGVEVLVRDTPEQIAKAAVHLIKDKILYKKLSQNAKEKVARKYDWTPIAEKLSLLYQELGNA